MGLDAHPIHAAPRRPPLRFALALALLPGCLTCPTTEDWLAVGFRSPTQTFVTFQTALAGRELDLEYRCWSDAFKRREGVNQLVYREFHEELLRERPWLRKAADAEVVAERRLAPDRAELVAEVRSVLRTVAFRVELVREDYYELWREDVRARDGVRPFDSLVNVSEDGGWLLGGAPLGELAAEDVSELRIGREWKIDALELVDDDAPTP